MVHPSLRSAFGLAGLLLLASALAGWSTVRYVKPDGRDGSMGLSWNTALKTIQIAINMSKPGDQVWVAQGTYPQQINIARRFMDGEYYQDGVAIYGGFTGTETALQQRDWRNNRTILEGSPLLVGIRINYCASPLTRLDGFVISGWATSIMLTGDGLKSNSPATITNNLILNGSADSSQGEVHRTGGIDIAAGACPRVLNNTFTGHYGVAPALYAFNGIIANNLLYDNVGNRDENTLPSCGAIMCGGPVKLLNNTIVENTSDSEYSFGNGDGIVCLPSTAGTPTIVNNIVAGNGCGISLLQGATATLRNNCVSGNYWWNYGAGVVPGAGAVDADPLFVDRYQDDFHLSALSPCRNAGDNSVIDAGWLDMDNEARQQGVKVDIGADEIAPQFQPDLQIRRASDTLFAGDGYYNRPELQTRAQSCVAGATAVYYVMVENDGDAADTFRLATAAAPDGWTVRIYDAATGGTDVFSALRDGGWATPSLDAGASLLLRVEVTPGATAPIGVGMQVVLTATSALRSTQTDAVVAMTTRQATPLSAVALTVKPGSPAYILTPITLSAAPTGGKTVSYEFRAGYKDPTNVWRWTVLKPYGSATSCVWTPNVARTYTVLVYARDAGSTKAYDVYASANFRVLAPTPLTEVSLTVTPGSPLKIGKTVSLKAQAPGGPAEYLFKVGHKDATGRWQWQILSNYSRTSAVTWTPQVTNTYTIAVYAREIGSTAVYTVYKSINYRVIP